MAEERDALGVHIGACAEIIERAAEAPTPRGDSTPIIRFPLRVRAILAERSAQAVLPTGRVIGLDVGAGDGGHGVAARENRLERPAADALAARGLGGFHELVDLRLGIRRPLLGDGNGGIGINGVVALEIHPEEGGHGLFRAVRQKEEERHAVPALFAIEKDVDLLTRGFAAESFRIRRADFINQLGRLGGTAAIHVRAEEFENFRPPLLSPDFRVGDLRAIGAEEGIGQRVGDNFRFVVVVAGGLSLGVVGDEGGGHDRGDGERGGAG